MIKMLPKNPKEIQDGGFYSFRVTSTSPFNGILEVLYSPIYMCSDLKELNRYGREYKESLGNKGYKNVEIVNISQHINGLNLHNSLTDLNGEFILDL